MSRTRRCSAPVCCLVVVNGSPGAINRTGPGQHQGPAVATWCRRTPTGAGCHAGGHGGCGAPGLIPWDGWDGSGTDKRAHPSQRFTWSATVRGPLGRMDG